MISVDNRSVACGLRLAGNRILGLDVGPESARSVIAAEGVPPETRAVLRVKGHAVTISRWDDPEYVGPCYYIILKNIVVGEIQYDRSGAPKAKAMVDEFLSAGEWPPAAGKQVITEGKD